jgi:hypothetical protein
MQKEDSIMDSLYLLYICNSFIAWKVSLVKPTISVDMLDFTTIRICSLFQEEMMKQGTTSFTVIVNIADEEDIFETTLLLHRDNMWIVGVTDDNLRII